MIITRNLVTIDKDQRLSDAIELMEKLGISRLLVNDNDEIVGIITEEDIANRLGSGRERTLKTSHIHVSAAMTRKLKVIEYDADMQEAARIMLNNGFSSLPVVKNGKIIGLVTKTDLIKNLRNSRRKVGEFYTRNPVLVNPNDSLVSARKLMLEHKIHRLLVTNTGLLAGIVTERDIASGLKTFRKALDKEKHPDIRKIRVEHVMTKGVITVNPENTVGEVVGIMLKNKISGIPVISHEFGIITKTDLVREIADGKFRI